MPTVRRRHDAVVIGACAAGTDRGGASFAADLARMGVFPTDPPPAGPDPSGRRRSVGAHNV